MISDEKMLVKSYVIFFLSILKINAVCINCYKQQGSNTVEILSFYVLHSYRIITERG